jgi:hypothetical protein
MCPSLVCPISARPRPRTWYYLRDGKKKKSELGLDVAFKFEGGWETGKVFMQETSKRNLGFFSIKVPGNQGYTLYDLKKETVDIQHALGNSCEGGVGLEWR